MRKDLEGKERCLNDMLSWNSREGTEESRDSLCHFRDSNRAPPRQVESVTATPAYSVSLVLAVVIIVVTIRSVRARVSVVVKVLCHKPEGRWFDNR
jgi:hypothetical protein